jgi:hypothetical protein
VLTELATGADEVVHPWKVVQHGRRRDTGPFGDVADACGRDALLVVYRQGGLDDPALRRSCSIGTPRLPVCPSRHYFIERIVR